METANTAKEEDEEETREVGEKKEDQFHLKESLREENEGTWKMITAAVVMWVEGGKEE